MDKGVVFSGKSNMTKEDSKSGVLRAVRTNCLECGGDNFEEVKYCSATDCALWPYRLGRTPRQIKEQELLNKTNFQEGARFDPEKMASQCH